MNILAIFHFILIFFPLSIYTVKNIKFIKFISDNIKWIFLIYLFVPLHWVFFENKCILTDISKKLGYYTETQTDSGFSETHMKWLYKPIMDLFGWEWNDKGLDKMVTLHSIFNILLIWYFTFYKLKNN